MHNLDHEITVSKLEYLLESLLPDDVLVPNAVMNLLIERHGIAIGFINLLNNRQQIELFPVEQD